MVLKAFECTKCSSEFDEIVSMNTKSTKCQCGSKAISIIKPVYVSQEAREFNPHYDEQLGTHFNSKEEKQSWLKKNNKEQISGFSSPRKSNKSSIICTREQAARNFGHLK